MIYSFGEFELDDVQVRLMHGGRPVKLEPKVFSVLLYLLQNRDRVATRMAEYHSDKVATLGAELRELAEVKSKAITAAYAALGGR